MCLFSCLYVCLLSLFGFMIVSFSLPVFIYVSFLLIGVCVLVFYFTNVYVCVFSVYLCLFVYC